MDVAACKIYYNYTESCFIQILKILGLVSVAAIDYSFFAVNIHGADQNAWIHKLI